MSTEIKPFILPEQRYCHDAHFAQLVDFLEAQIHAANLTPTEIREAAMLAAVHHSMREVSPMVYVGGAVAPRVQAGEPVEALPPVVLVNGVAYRREGTPP